MAVTYNFDAIPAFIAKSKEASAAGLTRAAIVLEREMKLIQQQTGPSGKKNPPHVRSRPGEPPARQWGGLVNRITFNAATPENLVSRAGTNLDYGRFLEFGTSKMAARPWVRPSLQRAKPKMRSAFIVAAKSVLGGNP